MHGHYTDSIRCMVTILIYYDARSLYWYTKMHGQKNIKVARITRCNIFIGSNPNRSQFIDYVYYSLPQNLMHKPQIFYSVVLVTVKKVKVPRNRPRRSKWRSRGIAPLFLDLGARRGWVASTTLWLIHPRQRFGTHCTGGWEGLRAGLDLCEKSRPYRDLIPGPSSP
jgi:hypothetical protein